jgi:hypothetical protein
VGETTPGIDAAMQSGGNITGRVTVAATGSPLMNADVCAFSLAALSVGDRTPEGCAQTNANGEYTLPQLTAGQDIVEFDDQFGAGFVSQYYDGKSSWTEATPLSVTAGVTITGVDAAMHAVGEEIVKPPPSPTETTLSPSLAYPMPLIEATPLVALATSKLVVSKGTARVLVACSRAACQGSIELVVRSAAHGRESKTAWSRKGGGVVAVVLATGSFSLAEGDDGSVVLRLTAAGRTKLAHARHHPLGAKLILSVRGGHTMARSVLAV